LYLGSNLGETLVALIGGLGKNTHYRTEGAR